MDKITPKRTVNPIVWFQYLCWCVQAWMGRHNPIYPDRLRFWLHGRYQDTLYATRQQIDTWEKYDKNYKGTRKPWPWYVGNHCMGPFLRPWDRVGSFFRRFTGGRSHRCEFTDPEHGALYGHKEGPFMDKLFEQFIERISLD